MLSDFHAQNVKSFVCYLYHGTLAYFPVRETRETSESSDDSADEDFPSTKQNGGMTVSSETMLTVTTETKRLDDSRFLYDDVETVGSHIKTCSSEDASRSMKGGSVREALYFVFTFVCGRSF